MYVQPPMEDNPTASSDRTSTSSQQQRPQQPQPQAATEAASADIPPAQMFLKDF